MAFAVGVEVGAELLIAYGVSDALSWELSCSLDLGGLGHLIGKVMKVVLSILVLNQLAYSSAANAAPFATLGGIVPGLIIGALVNQAFFYLRCFVFMTPGAQMQLMHHAMG